jgi:PAS domain S-box-containing protein
MVASARYTARDYTVALAVTALVILVRGALDPLLGDYQPLALLYASVAISVWLAGLYPSVVACVAGYVASNILFIEPRGRFALPHPHDWLALGGYLVAASVLILVGESLRRNRAVLRDQVAAGIRMERELAAARDQLLIVTDCMSALVTRCNRNFEYTWVSKTYASWLGLRPEEIVGRSIQDVIGREAFEQLQPHLERVLAGEVVRCEEEVPFPGQPSRWISAVYTPTLDAQGKPDGWVGVVTDTDQQKRAEQTLREADRRKNEFLALLAHELRAPLAPIRNAVRFLQMAAPQQGELQAARDIIDRQVDQMIRLIEDLLDISRITQGRIQIRKSRMELGPVVQLAVEASRQLITLRDQSLTVTVPSEPVWLEADPARIAQILSNLLYNAAKYTDPGGCIGLSVKREGHEVVLSVRDTGVGVRKEDLGAIFDMFAQRPLDPRNAVGGLGIGLALVRGLVELHKGSIEARSAGPGCGSEFIVRLPAPPSRGVPGADEIEVTRRVGAPLRILVVDDNRDTADSLRMLLSLGGREVRTAGDGIQAVTEAEQFRPDLVLLDIGLPVMDGYEVAREIRSRPWGSETVLVALTGWSREEDRILTKQAGFDYHLTKPADPKELEALLDRLTGRAPAAGLQAHEAQKAEVPQPGTPSGAC